jgi:lipoate-protein ligase A
LDIPAQVNEVVTNERNAKGPVCFEVPSNYEITVNGKKLIGSAQARRKEGVLQHGSLPLYGNLTRIIKVLVYSNEAKRADAESRLRVHATTTAEILGQPLTWDTAAKAFKAAFMEVLNLELSTGDLTPSERSRAAELVTEKYANPKWTERV